MVIDPLALDTSVSALVLKVGTYPLHHGSLGVVRSLGRLGVPVYRVYEERFAPAAVSRHLRGRFVWRCNADDSDRFLEGIAMVGERLGRPTVLIPTDDLGAILISEHAPTLSRWFRFPQPPPGLAHLLASKKGLHELCSNSLRETSREPAWFARDHLTPFLLMCLRFLLRGVRRALRLRTRRQTRRTSTVRYVSARRKGRRP